jgi:hypothetical protein
MKRLLTHLINDDRTRWIIAGLVVVTVLAYFGATKQVFQ